MKKIILFAAAVLVSAMTASAQDLGTATETAKAANEALTSGDYAGALASFSSALTMAEACGEDGAELVTTCKTVIPKIALQIAKNFIGNDAYAEGVDQLKKAAEIAAQYGQDEVADEATALIPQVYMQEAGKLLNAKDYAGAAQSYAQVLAIEPNNGTAALRYGMALGATGKVEEAVAAYETAMANGQEAPAKKQLSTLFVKEASSALKNKDYKAAAEAAEKSNGYLENANAYKIAGTAYSQLKQVDNAIGNLKKYLELSPSAKDANQMSYTIAALAQQKGDKATALEFYKKITSDPKLGETAKQQIAVLSK